MKEAINISKPETQAALVEQLLNLIENINAGKLPLLRQQATLFDDLIEKSILKQKLGLADSTLYKYQREGKLKAYAIGGKRYYRISEVESLLRRNGKMSGDDSQK